MDKIFYHEVSETTVKYKHELAVPFVLNETGTMRHYVTLCMNIDEMQYLYNELELALEEAGKP